MDPEKTMMAGDRAVAPAPDEKGAPAKSEAEAAPRKRDLWDKLDILGRPLAGLFGVLAVASIGLFGERVLSERSRSELFTQLMSQREEAESGLRGNMFTTILGQFFVPEESGSASNDASYGLDAISKQLLKLELLALNFGESLSLSPLFRELDRRIRTIESDGPPLLVRVDLAALKKRLRSLANRVTDWQISALAPRGTLLTVDCLIERTESGRLMFLGMDEDGNDVILEKYSYPRMESGEEFEVFCPGDTSQGVHHGTHRGLRMALSSLDETRRKVSVELDIIEYEGHPMSHGEAVAWEFELQDRSFALDAFDFPMIDNTRLSNGDRFALVFSEFDPDENALAVRGVFFPGLYTSQRDKPVFNEVIGQLELAGKE